MLCWHLCQRSTYTSLGRLSCTSRTSECRSASSLQMTLIWSTIAKALESLKSTQLVGRRMMSWRWLFDWQLVVRKLNDCLTMIDCWSEGCNRALAIFISSNHWEWTWNENNMFSNYGTAIYCSRETVFKSRSDRKTGATKRVKCWSFSSCCKANNTHLRAQHCLQSALNFICSS